MNDKSTVLYNFNAAFVYAQHCQNKMKRVLANSSVTSEVGLVAIETEWQGLREAIERYQLAEQTYREYDQ